jgi:outer membrane immunogenic protein
MRKSVLSLLAGTAMTTLAFSVASAADLPIREAPPAPMIQAVPIFTWTGFYIGVNAGAGWRDNNQESVFLTGPGIPGGLEGGILFFPNNGNDAVFVGGGQIGYNLQIGSFVVGVETDIQWADTDDGQNAVFIPGPGFPAGATFIPGSFEIGQDWFGTVRARAGVAFDRFLVYATGGLAYTDENTGWTLGGGVEWALPFSLFGNSAATFGVEGLWLSFDDDDNNNRGLGTFTPVGGAPVTVLAPVNNNDDNDFWVVRAKLNFKFGTY